MEKSKSNFMIVIILGLLSMLTPLAIDMYLPTFGDISRDLNVSQEMVQTTLAIFTFGFAIGQLFWGPLADSFGRKPIILAGLSVSVCCAFLLTQVSDIQHFYILRFLQGFFGASSVAVLGAILRDLFVRDEFAKMMSIIMIITMLAPLFAPIIGGYIAKFFHWHSIFFVLVAMGVICLFLVYFKLPETSKKENLISLNLTSVLKNFGNLLTNKNILGYTICSSMSFSGMFCFLTSGSLIYTTIFGIEKENFGFFFIPNVLIMILMSIINNKMIPKIGVKKMLKISLTIKLIAGIWLAICGIFGLGLWAMTIGIMLFIGMVSTIASNVSALALEDFPQMAGTTNSLLGTMRFGVGSIVGAILSTFSISSERPMLYMMFACIVIAFTAFFILTKNKTT